MLRQGEDVFLDDLSLDQVQAALSVPIELIGGADDLVAACVSTKDRVA